MARASSSVKTAIIFAAAFVSAVAALGIDKSAQWAFTNNLTFTGIVLRNDLQFLPGLLSLAVVALMFRTNRKAQITGGLAAVATAAVLLFLVGWLVRSTGWYSPLWQAIGYQFAYLFVPTFLAVIIGGLTARRAK